MSLVIFKKGVQGGWCLLYQTSFPKVLGHKLLVLVRNNYRPLTTTLPVSYHTCWGSQRFYLLN